MKFEVTITWSKIVAVFVLVGAICLDIKNGGIQAFMFSIPFVVALITGKQVIDKVKK